MNEYYHIYERICVDPKLGGQVLVFGKTKMCKIDQNVRLIKKILPRMSILGGGAQMRTPPKLLIWVGERPGLHLGFDSCHKLIRPGEVSTGRNF